MSPLSALVTRTARVAPVVLLLIALAVACGPQATDDPPASDGTAAVVRPGAIRYTVVEKLDAQQVETESVSRIWEELTFEGFELSLAEVEPDGSAAQAAAPRVAPPTTPLSDDRIEALLSRLPPISERDDDVQPFALRKASLAPPLSGADRATPFPPPDSSVAGPAPQVADKAPLTVIRHRPVGDVKLAPKVSLTFSSPMVPLTSIDDTIDARDVPARLEPAVTGEWRWLDTRTLEFVPSSRMPMATDYRVTVARGVASRTGSKVEKAFSFEFSTPPPQMVNWAPTGQSVGLSPQFHVDFDQEIDAARVLEKISVTANGKPVALRLDDAAEHVARTGSGDPKRRVAFSAQSELPRDAEIVVDIAAGTPSAEGPKVTTSSQRWVFRTYGPFRVVDARCENWNCMPGPGSGFGISLSNAIDPNHFDREKVARISPALDNPHAEHWGNYLRLTGTSKPSTTYTVELDEGLRDVFGQQLEGERKFTFTMSEARTYTSLSPSGASMVVLDPYGKPGYNLATTNVRKLGLRLYRVEPSMWGTYQDFVSRYFHWEVEERRRAQMPGTLVEERVVELKGSAEAELTRVDLSAALDNGVGHVVVVARPLDDGEEEDPRDPNPYNRHTVWIQATQLGLSAFVDDSEAIAWVTELRDGRAVADAQVEAATARGTTGKSGVANLSIGSVASADASEILLARRGADSAFLPRSLWTTWSPSPLQPLWYSFDDRGLYQPGETVRVKGWMRVADMREGGDIGYLPGGAATLEYLVRDPQWNELTRGTVAVDAHGGFSLAFELPDNTNLGWGYIEFTLQNPSAELGWASFSHSFQIQEFRRPEFEVSMNVPSGPHRYEGSAILDLSASYYSGGALAEAPTTWWARAQPGHFVPPDRHDFTFGTQWPWWMYRYGGMPWAQVSESTSGTTDAGGLDHVRVSFGAATQPVPVHISLEGSVTDVNRQQWTASGSMLVHPSERYIGLRTTRFFYEKGDTVEIETIVTDIDGKLVEGAPTEVSVARMAWVHEEGYWQQKAQQAWRCAGTSKQDVVQCRVPTTEGGAYLILATVRDAAGRANESRMGVWVAGADAPPNEGAVGDAVTLMADKTEYMVGDVAEVLVVAPWVPAEGMVTVRRSGVIHHERFTMTESSHTLRFPIDERHLSGVTLQVDLLGSKARKTDEPSETDAQSELPEQPAFARSSVYLEVPPLTRALTVEPSPRATELDPGSETSVEVIVRDFNGKPVQGAQVALVVIDEAILALSGYQLADPLPSFYTWRYDGSISAELRHMLLVEQASQLALNAMDMAGFAAEDLDGIPAPSAAAPGDGFGVGAGAAGRSAPQSAPAKRRAEKSKSAEAEVADFEESGGSDDAAMALRRNFEALAVFEPSAVTDADGRVSVAFKVPDNLTRYRVMAVAADERRFGKGESTITARLELMMRPSPPRFLNYGDVTQIPVVVQNLTDAAMTVEIATRASNLELTGARGVSVEVPARDRVEVQFPATTVSAGKARMQFAVASGKRSDAAEVSLPVWTPATTEAFAVYGVLDKGAVVQPVSVPGTVSPAFGGLEITTSSTALSALTDAVLFLIEYPFECNEQIASRLLGVVALRDVLAAFEAPGLPPADALAEFERVELVKLQQRQNSDGGFGWWAGDSVPYVSIHAAHALVRARAKGVKVDSTLYDRLMTNYIEKIDTRIVEWERRMGWPLGEATRAALVAYALYVRALDGQDITARATQLYASPGIKGMSLEATGWLLAALSTGATGVDKEKAAILRHLQNRVEETPAAANFTTQYTDGEYVMLHSNRRTDAVILDALMRATPDEALIPKVVQGLLAHRRKGAWSNTQENAFVLVALEEYFSRYEAVTPDFVARVWLGEDYAGEQTFQGRSADRQHLDIPMAYLMESGGGGERDLVLQKEGDGRLYYRLGMRYAPLDLTLEPLDRGFSVSRRYVAVDHPDDVRQDADGSWRIKAGATVRVELSMTTTNRRYHVALVDPLPAGLEALNPALATTSRQAVDNAIDESAGRGGWSWSRYWFIHQNLRDERAEAFTDLLWEGDYTYHYVTRATTPGTFVVPPLRAEEMYSPEVFGRSGTDRVIVE